MDKTFPLCAHFMVTKCYSHQIRDELPVCPINIWCVYPALRCLCKGKVQRNWIQAKERRKFSKIQGFWGVAPCFLKPLAYRHGVTSQKTWIIRNTTVRTSRSLKNFQLSWSYNFNFCWVNSSHVISNCCLRHNVGMNCILYQELTEKTAVTWNG